VAAKITVVWNVMEHKFHPFYQNPEHGSFIGQHVIAAMLRDTTREGEPAAPILVMLDGALSYKILVTAYHTTVSHCKGPLL